MIDHSLEYTDRDKCRQHSVIFLRRGIGALSISWHPKARKTPPSFARVKGRLAEGFLNFALADLKFLAE